MNKIFFTAMLIYTSLFSNAPTLNSDISASQSEKTNVVYLGENLFHGNFVNKSPDQFNEKYLINFHDKIKIDIWGQVEYSAVLQVDLKGNLYVPKIGVIEAKGKTPQQILTTLKTTISKLYTNNVFVYLNLVDLQPINIVLAGSVNQPGIYQGFPTDLYLQFIDKAKGINRKNGSFRKISVIRNNQVVKTLDTYSFLRAGDSSFFQFENADTIFVHPKSKSFSLNIGNEIPVIFELEHTENSSTLSNTLEYFPKNYILSTAIVIHKTTNDSSTTKIDSAKFSSLSISNGDEVFLSHDKIASNIKVLVEDQNTGNITTVILKNGDTLTQLSQLLNKSNNLSFIQLFRPSVAKEQKELLTRELNYLEKLTSNIKSGTPEEATIRATEASKTLAFIDKARQLTPLGQIIISPNSNPDKISIRDGDKITIVADNGVVFAQGEFLFPGTFTIAQDSTVKTLIKSAGGYSDFVDEDKVLLIHSNGVLEKISSNNTRLKSGDKVLAMQKIDSKTFQYFKDITSVLYQITLATGIVLGL